MNAAPRPRLADDLLVGAEAIAAELGLKPRQVYELSTWPIWRDADTRKLMATRSGLRAHVERRQAEALARRQPAAA